MRISSIEPSSVILSQTCRFKNKKPSLQDISDKFDQQPRLVLIVFTGTV